VTPAFRELMAFECARARALFERGRVLAGMVDGLAGREIGLFASGGLAILDRLEAVGYDVFDRRPTLSRWAKAGLVARGVLFGGRS
jgi:phytoene synthase